MLLSSWQATDTGGGPLLEQQGGEGRGLHAGAGPERESLWALTFSAAA